MTRAPFRCPTFFLAAAGHRLPIARVEDGCNQVPGNPLSGKRLQLSAEKSSREMYGE